MSQDPISNHRKFGSQTALFEETYGQKKKRYMVNYIKIE